MSPSGRILQFPRPRVSDGLTPSEARRVAQDYLALRGEEKLAEYKERFLCSPDVLLSICAVLKQNRDLAPASVLAEAAGIYHWISQSQPSFGLFDERDYFLGEMALIAGGVCRQLGRREESFLWLDRAEAGFRHTMNPAPGLANVAYARLALRFEMGRYHDVLELAPSLESSFAKLRMDLEAVKCRLLLATTLKLTGHHAEALQLLSDLQNAAALHAEPLLRARILAELGDVRQLEGDVEKAMEAFQTALALLDQNEVSSTRADLKLYVGGAYQILGFLQAATEAFREAQRDYLALEMGALVAYCHLVIAETLLELKREREAEWEVMAALPLIDQMKMIPEGVAAIGLLRQSVSQRKTDAGALRRLREQLQAGT